MLTTPAFAFPELPAGRWVDITPPTVQKGSFDTCIGQGITIDPQQPATIFWGTTPFLVEHGGMFKSTDGGSNWMRVAAVTPAWDGASDHLDMPLHIKIDPNDSKHLYAGDGVRGSTQGFYISTDGGATFVKPQGFVDAIAKAGIDNQDVYDVAVNPKNFGHVLVTFHYRWGWTDTKWNTSSGVMESRDGGMTWSIHEPQEGWGSGHSINFLYDPVLGIGNDQTWLLGTQGAGYWRTADGGGSWTKVSATNITHGGASLYYAKSGYVYAAGERTLRSNDNGVTWEEVGPQSSWGVWGDGDRLYTGGGWASNQPIQVSSETDGVSWVASSDQTFVDGPFELTYDQYYGIMYASSWSVGVWAMKVREGTGMKPPYTAPLPVGGSPLPSNGGAAGAGASGAGASGAGAPGISAGTGPGPEVGEMVKTHSDGGCACAVASPVNQSRHLSWLVLAGVVAAYRFRRRA